MPKPKAATAPQVTDTPFPEGMVRVYPFNAESVDVTRPEGVNAIPEKAMCARQYQENGEFHWLEADGTTAANHVWGPSQMAAFLPAPVVTDKPEGLNPPLPKAVNVEAPKLGVYPEQKEYRHLKTHLSQPEIADAAGDLARVVVEIQDVEAEKKAVNADIAGRLESLKKRQNATADLVRHGFREKRTECEWLFECAGIDMNGAKVIHPDMKTLVRLDTGSVVEVRAMTDEDFNLRQLGSAIATPPAEPKAETPPAPATEEPIAEPTVDEQQEAEVD